MYCSTCGAMIPNGRRVCETCGTPQFAVAARSGGVGRAEPAVDPALVLAACPRCAYRGEGIAYFSRGSRLAALVGVTMLSAGVMGAGGLIYYLMRRDHRICPRCGKSWGALGERAVARWREGSVATPRDGDGDGIPVGREGMKRVLSVVLFVFAAILMIAGISDPDLAATLFGVGMAGGGVALRRSADRERERRREALLSALQGPVLRLAAERGGLLTVTEVAARLGWTIRRAERVLHSMDDGLRVDSEVTDEGMIVYRFLELETLTGGGEEPLRLPDPGA